MDHEIEEFKIKTAVQNKNFDSDVEYAIKLNRWLLKPFGIWPLNSSSTKFDRGISVISSFICCLLLFFVMIPSFVVMFVSEKDFKGRLEIVGPTSFIIMVVLKYFFLITRGDTLKMCIDTILGDWSNVQAKEERKIMFRNAKIARLFTIICVSFMYCGGIFYSIFLPLITAKSLTNGNNLTIRILPYRCNFIIFDPYRRPIFDIVYVVHCFCSVIMYSITTGICSLAAKFVMHACGQCEIVMSLLENLIDDDKQCSDIVESKLATIIVQHLHVIRFVTRVEDLLNEVCLVEFLGCTMNMCLVGYYIITGFESADTVRFITFTLLFISFTFNIFVFCYIGQILTNHCHQIGEASYMIDWYRFPGTQARFLILLIGVANRPIRLTAGKMVQFSFPCFCNVIKAAMAYLNIIRTVTI
ncbi:odorant receptor 67c-like [Cephus cinctus]|uniref:Odorant receptor n=1 Tax=Cephus cinctus TaxID=211228 RepID=S5TEG5_CEPCN|nr:odorant receptor 67c-like [Cephus cinctus]AGS43065.1 odorant receptor Or3f [Cephus cinctus]